MKYNKEQLERILKAHVEGKLTPFGRRDFWECGIGCINQHAFQEPSQTSALNKNVSAATWFDHSYDPRISADAFKTALFEAGFVEKDEDEETWEWDDEHGWRRV